MKEDTVVKVGNYWRDKSNNGWHCDSFSKENAIKFSKSLKDCMNCEDCINCTACINCSYCINCTKCKDSRNCKDCLACDGCCSCTSCIECFNCEDCWNCKNCNECYSCTDCDYCTDCKACYSCGQCFECKSCEKCMSCSKFDDNPQCYITPRIGSRHTQTRMYWNDKRVIVITGCFRGTIEQLEKRVMDAHKHNPEFLSQYLREIEIMKYLIKN